MCCVPAGVFAVCLLCRVCRGVTECERGRRCAWCRPGLRFLCFLFAGRMRRYKCAVGAGYVLFYLLGIDHDKICFFIFCIAVDGCGEWGGDPGRF